VVSKKTGTPDRSARAKKRGTLTDANLANSDALGSAEMPSRMPDSETLRRHAHRHYALADATRLKILYTLNEQHRCPCHLMEITGTGGSKLSYHLRVLHEEGLVNSDRRKNWKIYSITQEGRICLRMLDLHKNL